MLECIGSSEDNAEYIAYMMIFQIVVLGGYIVNSTYAFVLVAILMLACGPVLAWTQNDFIITFWCAPPPTDEALANAAREGYNLTWSSEDGLDAVNKHGLKAILHDPLLTPAVLDDPSQEPKLDDLIARVKNHPALGGYHLTDEPGSGAFADLGRLTEYIRKRDPNHFSYINLFPVYACEAALGVSADAAEREKVGIPSNFAGIGDYKRAILAYKEHLRQYLKVVKPELLSYDHYHFLKDNVDGNLYFLNLALIREAALSADLPFINIIQACTIEPSWRLVNKNELRWLVYTTLAYGGRGISYFLYWGPEKFGGLYQDGKQTPLALDVADLNTDLKAVGREMMKLKSTAVYQTEPLPVGGEAFSADSPVKVSGGEFILGLFKSGSKDNVFMIVNRDYKKTSRAQVMISGDGKILQEFNPANSKWSTYCSLSHDKPVIIGLEPGEGKLFRMQ